MRLNAAQFIDRKGGPAAIARATGLTAGAISLWRHRNKIPRSAWPELIEAFPDVTLDALKKVEATSAKAAAQGRGAA